MIRQIKPMAVVAAKSYIEYRNDAYWVEGTRISLDSVVYAFQKVVSPESIVQSFALLTLEQVYGAIAFYLANRADIDTYLTTEEAAFNAMPQPLQCTDPTLYNKIITAKAASIMPPVSNGKDAIVRTERGLTITGTRITIYDVMDYIVERYPSKFIRSMLGLTEEQIDAALFYIKEHQVEVKAEYQAVLQEAEELRQYWEEQNRELLDQIAAKPPKPGTEAIRAKLQAAKAKLQDKA